MPMLERQAPAASNDDPTLDAIEAIRAVLMATVESDGVTGEIAQETDPQDGHAADREAPAAAAVGPYGHGKIRLHGRD
jgi:hypothetical protein